MYSICSESRQILTTIFLHETAQLKGTTESSNLNSTLPETYIRKYLMRFSKHELFPSVEYELNHLSNYRDTIDSLNVIANSNAISHVPP